ncbi:Putative ribonuclease H protein At1g65750 [Linum perenne]
MKLGWTILKDPGKLWVWVVTSKYLKDTREGLRLRRKRMEPPRDDLGEDDIIWGPDPRGKFTLKTAYDILASTGHHTDQDIWRIVWRWKGPNRVRHFLWLVAHDRILTNEEREVWSLFIPPDQTLQAWHKTGLQHKDFGLTFGIITWILWKAQNEAFFENKLVTCDQLRLRVLHWIAWVRETMKADSQVASRIPSRRIESHIGWKAGPRDYITVNTDESVILPNSQAAAGGILRNHLGRPVSTFTANLGRYSIMRAELRAAQFGLMIAWDRGFRKVHLQLDSLAAISAMRGGGGG